MSEEHTPKLFSEDLSGEESNSQDNNQENDADELFNQEVNEDEDFEIPAFLRRQKF